MPQKLGTFIFQLYLIFHTATSLKIHKSNFRLIHDFTSSHDFFSNIIKASKRLGILIQVQNILMLLVICSIYWRNFFPSWLCIISAVVLIIQLVKGIPIPQLKSLTTNSLLSNDLRTDFQRMKRMSKFWCTF